ncbi:MAG: phosphatidate cytidylyltransferase [Bacteroidetes bacterium]|nr:phosphatidate cytidylyltransferase [Bacteroidota bacterium]
MAKAFSKLSTRVIVAVLGIPLIVIVSLYGKYPFLAFAAFIGLVSFHEFSKMVKNRKYFTNNLVGYLAIVAIILNEYKTFIDFKILFFLIVAVLLLFELFRNKESAVSNLGASLLGIFYIGFFSSALVSLREFYNDSIFIYSQGGYLIISILVAIWICDSAAYFLGTAYGKNKLMPRVSPNKSWEGAFAGFVFSIIGMLACKSIMADFLSWSDAIVIGLIVGTVGQIGDLIESLIKRDTFVKDSSSIIPGHGGIFDRFDSLLFSAPVVYLYLNYIAK